MAPISIYTTYQDASIYAQPNSIWRMVLFCILFYVIIAFLSYFLLREHLPAGLIATVAVLGILYPWRTFIVILLSVALSWVLLGIVGKKFDFNHPHFSAIGVSIIIAVYFGVSYIQFSQSLDWDENKSLALPIDITVPPNGVQDKPDIYYIILDGYGSEEMLRKLHGYDNSQFTAALKERGFIVPSNSKSNYPRTILSLASSLNMQYLDSVSEAMGDSFLWWPLMGTYAHNETRKFLESQGYQTVVVSSSWDFTTIKDADIYMRPYSIFLNKFEELQILNTNLSLFQFVSNFGISFPAYNTHRQVVMYEFEKLKEIPSLGSPKFTFVHIMSPHAPFVFDAEGNFITPDYPFTFSDDRYFLFPSSKHRKGYLNQLRFINTQVIDVVDAILANSSTPPIIIIQGDHGSSVFTDYNSLDNTCLEERFSILNAYYLPGIDEVTIPQNISPVNTFRLIFNYYFSAELEILPNHNCYSVAATLYQFEDVTDRVDIPCQISEEDMP